MVLLRATGHRPKVLRNRSYQAFMVVVPWMGEWKPPSLEGAELMSGGSLVPLKFPTHTALGTVWYTHKQCLPIMAIPWAFGRKKRYQDTPMRNFRLNSFDRSCDIHPVFST